MWIQNFALELRTDGLIPLITDPFYNLLMSEIACKPCLPGNCCDHDAVTNENSGIGTRCDRLEVSAMNDTNYKRIALSLVDPSARGWTNAISTGFIPFEHYFKTFSDSHLSVQ